MGDAKRIVVKPISSADARCVVARYHYSHKSTQNSQLHLGVFLDGELHGAMQFGPSIDKRRMLGLVRGTQWENFIELNRMAFGPALPRNSESRALSVAFKMLRKNAPAVKWIVSFADGTQCGDGTIYRASGFLLTGISKNKTLLAMPDGQVVSDKSLNNTVQADGRRGASAMRIIAKKSLDNMSSSDGKFGSTVDGNSGAVPLAGFQLRYIKFLDPSWTDRLTVPVLPFSAIADAGASMYLGVARSGSRDDAAPGLQPGEGGSSPTPELHSGFDK